MSQQPDNELDRIQRLLACKRFEKPPPGYFGSFSEKVLAGIQAEGISEHSSWWSWFVAKFDARPALVCGYAMAVSGLLFVGFNLSQVFEAELRDTPGNNGPWLAATPASPMLLSSEWRQPVGELEAGTPAAFSSIARPSSVERRSFQPFTPLVPAF
jgi:hypothetical protein